MTEYVIEPVHEPFCLTANHSNRRPAFRGAVFDFDGTVSLLTEGWQEDMINQFADVLLAETDMEAEAGRQLIADFIFELTGKSPIYQCIRLCEEVQQRGGRTIDPDDVLAEYGRRMDRRLNGRMNAIRSGKVEPDGFMVPGVRKFMTKLDEAGVKMLLVSGSEMKYIVPECQLLQIDHFFQGRIFGPPEDSRNFAKQTFIRQFIDSFGFDDTEIVGFGDGFVETSFIHQIGGYAVGVASEETLRCGVNQFKRKRLLEAGADCIVPDFSNPDALAQFLGI